jgi:hypothetical protein
MMAAEPIAACRQQTRAEFRRLGAAVSSRPPMSPWKSLSLCVAGQTNGLQSLIIYRSLFD